MDKIDGDVAWSGGMDASRLPHLLPDGYFHRGCNVRIDSYSGDLKNRYGFECIKLVGDSDAICIYNNARNVQAEGYYRHGHKHILVRLVDGWIVELEPINESIYQVKVRNLNDRRGSSYSKGWITTIPGGVIVNDGYELPHIVKKDSIRRSNPSKDEIGVGRMGVYLQNRFFYVDGTGKLIRVSDFRNPISVENSKIANIKGFLVPDDKDVITAIGNRQQRMNYVEGGSLSFSTVNDTYSVDVRGDIQNWEEGNTALGKVQESLPGIGAVSAYSYENFSSNLFFRSIENGLINLGYAQSQFQDGEQFTDYSYGLMNWFSKDDQRMLSRCYTRKFGNRLYTTVAPEINRHGKVYWCGMVSMIPGTIIGGQKAPTIFEGLITGVRPWCMTSHGQNLFVDSYDTDGMTRLYRLNIKLDHDVNHLGDRVEIESWLETRSYGFKDLIAPKVTKARAYSLIDIPRDLEVATSSRTEHAGSWQEFFQAKHYIHRPHTKLNDYGLNVIDPVDASQQDRVNFKLPKENEGVPNYGGLGGGKFIFRQYRFKFTGAYTLGPFLVYAASEKASEAVSPSESENDKKIARQTKLSDYNYTIHGHQ